MIMMMVFTMMVGMFAYEPKKECAKVKRNGEVVYYEKTELYNHYGFKPDPKNLCRWYNLYSGTTYDYEKWAIRKGYTVEQLIDYDYRRLKSLRDSYIYCMGQAKNPDISDADIAIVNCLNKINGTNSTPEEYESKTWLQHAEYGKRTAILSIPFTTEENFLIITKEEMLARMLDFVEEVKSSK